MALNRSDRRPGSPVKVPRTVWCGAVRAVRKSVNIDVIPQDTGDRSRVLGSIRRVPKKFRHRSVVFNIAMVAASGRIFH
jgi:hypothetical protein